MVTNLKYLSLYDNLLQKVPEEIGNLTNLRYLSLDDNQIRELPVGLSNLTNLQTLVLSGNPIQMKDIPENLRRLVHI